MARRSLRPHLNQIRGWVRQGRTDAWIAHQLEVTVQQIEAFKRENDLVAGDDLVDGPTGVDFDDEIDLRAEDDALIAAELEAEAARAEEEGDEEEEEEEGDDEDKPKRRRGRRGGRGRRPVRKSSASTFEGTFDHGEEGYGLWLDPAVADSQVYADHWAGKRAVLVTLSSEAITIRPADGSTPDPDDSED